MKYLWKCMECKTVLVIETDLPEETIDKYPLCLCGKHRMTPMNSPEYAYGPLLPPSN